MRLRFASVDVVTVGRFFLYLADFFSNPALNIFVHVSLFTDSILP